MMIKCENYIECQGCPFFYKGECALGVLNNKITFMDYTVAQECKNPETIYTCYKCGKCGRKFENGFMVDDGGTTPDESE